MNNLDKSKIEKIAKKYNLKIVVLFGSRAEDNFNKNSDYDIAYFSEKPLKNKFDLWSELENLVDKKVDLIEINTNDSVILRNEIFSKGVCLYEEKKGLFEDFASKSFLDYQDSKSYINEFKNIIKKSLEEM